MDSPWPPYFLKRRKETEMEYTKIDKVTPLPYNPTSRINMESGYMKDLVLFIQKRIEKNLPPLPDTDAITIGKDGYLGDGHRRIAALKFLGVEHVPFIVDGERTGLEIWRDRASAKPPTSRNVSEAAFLGLKEEYWPKQQREAAEIIRKYSGEDGLNLVIKNKVSFGINHVLSQIMKYLNYPNNPKLNGYKILKWLVKHKMQRIARHAIEYLDIKTSVLERAIIGDRPLKLQ